MIDHNTTRLGKPFKTVKSISFVTYDASGQFHHAKAHLYLDTRGDAGFAIGIPKRVHDLVGDFCSLNLRYRETVRIHVNKTGGEPYVKADTADKAKEDAKFVYEKYKEMVDELNKAEIIRISFSALVPEFDAQGTPTGNHAINSTGTRFGGSAGSHMELSFMFQRGFRVGDKFVIKREDGSTYKDYMGRGGIEIPFKQETWDQLVSVRETITTALQALHGVFGGDQANIPALLMAGFTGSRLLGPPTPQIEASTGPEEEFDYPLARNPPPEPRCLHCGHKEGNHKSGTAECPKGRRTGIGYTQFGPETFVDRDGEPETVLEVRSGGQLIRRRKK